MATLLVLAATQDGDSLAEGRRLLALARQLGHSALPLVWNGQTWSVGGAADEHGALVDTAPAPPGPGPSVTTPPAEARIVLAQPAERRLPPSVLRAVADAPWPLAGCSPVAAALAGDRLLSKLAASQLGARCPGHEEVAETHRPYWTIQQRLGLPVAVKPVRRGLAAVRLVHDQEGLRPAVAAAQQADPEGACLIEEWHRGTPVAVTVLADSGGVRRALPLVGLPRHGDSDEGDDASRDRTPVPAASVAELAQLAVGLAEQLGLGGLCQLEAIAPQDGGRPVFLGLESHPSLAPGSAAALAAQASGVDERALLSAALEGSP